MSERTVPMSQRRYRKEGGTCCPFCGSEDMEGGPVEIDAGTATQEVSCNTCEKSWQDVYTLHGYQETK